MIKIEIIKNVETNFKKADFIDICEKFFLEDKKNIEKLLVGKEGIVSLVFCDDKEIKRYNKKIRGIDKATDVLSFVYFEKAYDNKNKHVHTIAGDILISMDTAKKQAQKKQHTIKNEVLILFTHGLLHIFGYDHKNDKEENKMEKMSEKILNNIR